MRMMAERYCLGVHCLEEVCGGICVNPILVFYEAARHHYNA